MTVPELHTGGMGMVSSSNKNPTTKNHPEFDLFQHTQEGLAKSLGKPIALQATPQDIGGELIAILSKGLYTNPLDCLREYAQNAVDAKAETITIKITGNTVIILDDGVGMGLAQLLEAKKFGLSSKSISQHVGFRGIGIYSGFDICRRLVIKSTRAGEAEVYEMSFEFAAMKAQLDKERQSTAGGERTSLVDLLSAHTKIARMEEPEQTEEHYTYVELREIQPEHIERLSDRRRLREYLLQNLPIAFAPGFMHGATIDARLRQSVPGYNPIIVKLQLVGSPEETVYKYGPSSTQIADHAEAVAAQPGGLISEPKLILNLAEPSFREIQNKSGQLIALYWACLNQERTRLEPKEDNPQFEGFIYKVKGFSIGDRNKLRPMFPRSQLYPWFTGEVYVIDPNVVPNAERNDFEMSAAKTTLEVELLDGFRKHLKPLAENFQARAKAEEKINKYANQIAALEKDYSAIGGAQRVLEDSDLERLTELSNIIDDLPDRRKKVGPGKNQVRAEALLARAKALRKSLANLIQNPQSTVAKRRAEENKQRSEPMAGGGDAAKAVQVPSLAELFAEAGWDLEPNASEVVALMQAALDDLLGHGSPEYRRFAAYFIDRLNDPSDRI
jgi:hypothetical protein